MVFLTWSKIRNHVAWKRRNQEGKRVWKCGSHLTLLAVGKSILCHYMPLGKLRGATRHITALPKGDMGRASALPCKAWLRLRTWLIEFWCWRSQVCLGEQVNVTWLTYSKTSLVHDLTSSTLVGYSFATRHSPEVCTIKLLIYKTSWCGLEWKRLCKLERQIIEEASDRWNYTRIERTRVGNKCNSCYKTKLI